MVQVNAEFPKDSDYIQLGFNTICDLAKQRLRNLNDEFKTNNSSMDFGYRALKTDSSNMKDVFYAPKQS